MREALISVNPSSEEYIISQELLGAKAVRSIKTRSGHSSQQHCFIFMFGWMWLQYCVTSDSGVSSGKAYPPEFYYDTYSALWQNRPRVYGFKLQWTQMEPNAVDRILAYRLGIRQVSIEHRPHRTNEMTGICYLKEIISLYLLEKLPVLYYLKSNHS